MARRPREGRPFLLYVGLREGYKNFHRLLAAYSRSQLLKRDFDLVCFGGGALGGEERSRARDLGVPTARLRYVSGGDEALAQLYASAAALVYPSVYEGFGIPPLEAMSVGCPVICSNSSSLPEVVGDAAELFDPLDEDQIRSAMERVVMSEGLRKDLSERGRRRCALFSWQVRRGDAGCLPEAEAWTGMRRALICGVSGQDGAYLARHLLRLGYQVHGTSRDAQMAAFDGLRRLGIRDRVLTWSMAPNDFRSVLHVVHKVEPNEIYNLSGQSSVGLSFEHPVETMESIMVGTLNLLEAIRFLAADIRFYNAGSSECFGDTHGVPADEGTGFSPRSPYAVAKSAAHWQVANYREAYDLFACTGVLFNHESSLRPSRFVTKKIVEAVRRIAAGSREKLILGNPRSFATGGGRPSMSRRCTSCCRPRDPTTM